MSHLTSTTYESPVGTLTLVAGDAGLRAVIWPDGRLDRVGLGGDDGHTRRGGLSWPRPRRSSTEYFAGTRTTFELPLDLEGTAFQLAAWQALGEIPYGETRTYAAAGGPHRPADGRSGGRGSERPQSGLDRPSLPSRDRQRRLAARVRRRARGEGRRCSHSSAVTQTARPRRRGSSLCRRPALLPSPRPGRARWGGSGSLNPKSAPAGPNAVRGTVSSGLGLRTRC